MAEVELEPMARVEEDTLDAAAPLLESPRHDNTSSPNTRDEDDTSVIDVLSLTGTGTWFIWALTFSAGISGFLFGYEYVQACIKILFIIPQGL